MAISRVNALAAVKNMDSFVLHTRNDTPLPELDPQLNTNAIERPFVHNF